MTTLARNADLLLMPNSHGHRVNAEFGTLTGGTWSYQKIGSGPGLDLVGLASDSNGLPRAAVTADIYAVFAYFTPK